MLHITAAQSFAHGLPPVAVSLEVDTLAEKSFPFPGALVSLEGAGGLPHVLLLWVNDPIADARGLATIVEGGGAPALTATARGESGELSVAGALRPALVFYGRSDTGQAIAGCAVAIALEGTALVLVLGLAATPATVKTPADLAKDRSLAAIVDSLRIDLARSRASDTRRAARLKKGIAVAFDSSTETLRFSTPLEQAEDEIDDLRLLLRDPPQRGDDAPRAESRALLAAELDRTRSQIDAFKARGLREAPDRALALAVAAFAGVPKDDPLSAEVEAALRRIVQLLHPYETAE
jgi:hypothetical protein